jgi:hypothetical protein
MGSLQLNATLAGEELGGVDGLAVCVLGADTIALGAEAG